MNHYESLSNNMKYYGWLSWYIILLWFSKASTCCCWWSSPRSTCWCWRRSGGAWRRPPSTGVQRRGPFGADQFWSIHDGTIIGFSGSLIIAIMITIKNYHQLIRLPIIHKFHNHNLDYQWNNHWILIIINFLDFGNACLGDKLNVAKIRTKLGKIANALYF